MGNISLAQNTSWLDEGAFGEIYDNWTTTCLEVSKQPLLYDSYLETFVNHYHNSDQFTEEDLKLNIPFTIARYLVKKQPIPEALTLAYVALISRRTFHLRQPMLVAEQNLSTKEQSLHNAQQAFQAVQSAVEESQQQLLQLQNKILSVNKDLQTLSIWNRLVTSTSTALNAERDRLQQELEQIENQHHDLQFKLAFAESDVIRLRNEISNAKKENDTVTTEFQSIYQSLLSPLATTLQSHATQWFTQIEAGRYWRGSMEGHGFSSPMTQIQLNTPFIAGTTPVTQALFIAVMGHNPSEFVDLLRPVEMVSWFEALHFCNELSRSFNLEPAYAVDENSSISCLWQANGFRLPLEAEWEAIARGKDNIEPLDINKYAWHATNAKNKTQRVRQRRQLSTGTYDMVGNVQEWCWDWFDKFWYQQNTKNNPIGPSIGTTKVLRGGSYNTPPKQCTVYQRFDAEPNTTTNSIGFRIVSNSLQIIRQIIHS